MDVVVYPLASPQSPVPYSDWRAGGPADNRTSAETTVGVALPMAANGQLDGTGNSVQGTGEGNVFVQQSTVVTIGGPPSSPLLPQQAGGPAPCCIATEVKLDPRTNGKDPQGNDVPKNPPKVTDARVDARTLTVTLEVSLEFKCPSSTAKHCKLDWNLQNLVNPNDSHGHPPAQAEAVVTDTRFQHGDDKCDNGIKYATATVRYTARYPDGPQPIQGNIEILTPVGTAKIHVDTTKKPKANVLEFK